MKEAGFCRNRMVQALFLPPPFCNQRIIWRRRNHLSCYICFTVSFLCIFVMYLLFILWDLVENNQPLFYLELSCFFPLTLILCTLLNSLYFCSLMSESQKGHINSGLTHCNKTFVVTLLMRWVVQCRPRWFSIASTRILSSSIFF